jgi:hypothetical protein
MNKRTKNLRVNQAIGLGALDSNGQEEVYEKRMNKMTKSLKKK